MAKLRKQGQRRHALIHELFLLQQGGPLLLPVRATKETILGRFSIRGIRLGLKSFVPQVQTTAEHSFSASQRARKSASTQQGGLAVICVGRDCYGHCSALAAWRQQAANWGCNYIVEAQEGCQGIHQNGDKSGSRSYGGADSNSENFSPIGCLRRGHASRAVQYHLLILIKYGLLGNLLLQKA
ncbi:unnamed protein product [Protopolystoma xenopodis]|uniref:Uncharacterized protein n=1 Tax=Protopolystoma xenopodis TaxID=117903 RepID=A0A3S5CKD6_9PLAT|nr:unnamed protein product [Protopolystoma xenopodis]